MQSTTLRQFRQELESLDLLCDGHRDDTTLCRFLRARKWDVAKTLAMWQDMRSWRQSYAVLPAEPGFSAAETAAVRHAVPSAAPPPQGPTILERTFPCPVRPQAALLVALHSSQITPPARPRLASVLLRSPEGPSLTLISLELSHRRRHVQILKHYPHFVHKTDKYGRPVHYELLGELNITGLMRAASSERILKHHSLGWEHTKSVILPACSVAAQRDVFTCVSVIDLKGLSMTSFTKDVRTFVAAVAQMDQVCLPCLPH